MAITAVLTESQLLVKVGDGGGTEVFAHPCMINLDRSFGVSHNYEEDELPDCDTPTNPHDIVRYLRSIDYTVSGSGKVNAADIDTYLDWATGGTTKNCQIQVGGSTTGRYLEGAFYCQIDFSGTPKRNAECSITLTPANTGAITVNDVS